MTHVDPVWNHFSPPIVPCLLNVASLPLESENDHSSYEVTGAGSGRPSFDGNIICSPAVTVTNKYEELVTPVTATPTANNDDDSVERGDCRRRDGSDCEEGGARNEGEIAGGGYELSTTINQARAEVGWGGEDEEEEGDMPGVFGPGGLLSTPHVKVLLFLAFIVQARIWKGKCAFSRNDVVKITGDIDISSFCSNMLLIVASL